MSLDINALRRIVAHPLDLDLSDPLVVSDIDVALNRSFWEICNKFNFRLEEILQNWNTIIGERNYNIPEPLENLASVSIEDLNSQAHTPLGQITAEVYEKRYVANEDNWAKPTHYVREYCLIKLWPTPDDIYPMVLRRRIALSDISAGANPEFDVPREWHEPIGLGGLWRMYGHFGDWPHAREVKGHQVAILGTLKEMQEKEEQANTSLSGLEVAWSEYGEFTGADGGRI